MSEADSADKAAEQTARQEAGAEAGGGAEPPGSGPAPAAEGEASEEAGQGAGKPAAEEPKPEAAAPAPAAQAQPQLQESQLPYSDEVKSYLTSLETAPVIDWNKALKQVDNDRNFLFELLQDLYREGLEHLKKCLDAVQEWNVLKMQEHAHAVKGAAANVMCFRLRWAAAAVERSCKDQMAGVVSDDHLRLMMHFRIPVFHSEFATFIELLKVNNLLPTA